MLNLDAESTNMEGELDVGLMLGDFAKSFRYYSNEL